MACADIKDKHQELVARLDLIGSVPLSNWTNNLIVQAVTHVRYEATLPTTDDRRYGWSRARGLLIETVRSHLRITRGVGAGDIPSVSDRMVNWKNDEE